MQGLLHMLMSGTNLSGPECYMAEHIVCLHQQGCVLQVLGHGEQPLSVLLG